MREPEHRPQCGDSMEGKVMPLRVPTKITSWMVATSQASRKLMAHITRSKILRPHGTFAIEGSSNFGVSFWLELSVSESLLSGAWVTTMAVS